MVCFKAKARDSAYFTKLGWRRGCVFVGGVCGGVCEGRVDVCLWLGWLGCVRRVGMYWKEGEKR